MLNHNLCWDFSSHLAFFFFFNSNKLSYLLLCLFFLVAMTTESSCKVSLYDACQSFFFPVLHPLPPLKVTIKNQKASPALMFLPTLCPFILKTCCFWAKRMHIWMLTNRFLLQNTSLSLEQLLSTLPHTHTHTHAHNLLLHHNPSA